MAHLSIVNLTVEFKIYGPATRSIKNQILSQATGGRIAKGSGYTVTVKALDNISMNISDGDRVGLIGHNGAGKSTLLRTLAGIYKPTSGMIEIKGTVGTLIDPAAGMDPEATGIENIYLRGYVLGFSRKKISCILPAVSELTGLGDYLSLPVKTYSAGMYARLGFAISTFIEPDILLLDENIGAGDRTFLEKALTHLDSFVNRSSITIFASHDESLINRFCNKRVVLGSGQIIENKRNE